MFFTFLLQGLQDAAKGLNLIEWYLVDYLLFGGITILSYTILNILIRKDDWIDCLILEIYKLL
jgi:hypothetical protein